MAQWIIEFDREMLILSGPVTISFGSVAESVLGRSVLLLCVVRSERRFLSFVWSQMQF